MAYCGQFWIGEVGWGKARRENQCDVWLNRGVAGFGRDWQGVVRLGLEFLLWRGQAGYGEAWSGPVVFGAVRLVQLGIVRTGMVWSGLFGGATLGQLRSCEVWHGY